MPWTCQCGASVEDGTTQCPTCQVFKTAWTLIEDKTRLFVLTASKFTLQRGDSLKTFAQSDPEGQAVTLSLAEEITALPKGEVLDAFEPPRASSTQTAPRVVRAEASKKASR